MGKVLHIKPNIQWPWGVPFRIRDEFNGKRRGEWFYREPIRGDVRGPFYTDAEAISFLHIDMADASRV